MKPRKTIRKPDVEIDLYANVFLGISLNAKQYESVLNIEQLLKSVGSAIKVLNEFCTCLKAIKGARVIQAHHSIRK